LYIKQRLANSTIQYYHKRNTKTCKLEGTAVAEQPAICEEFRPNLSLQPALATERQIPEAPEHDAGGFFDRPHRVRRQSLETPVDFSTGVPLPIYPPKRLPPIIRKGQKNVDRFADWHHPFHPREPLVHGSLGLQALRGCRVQWARYEDHHDGVGYHQTFAGPPLPETELQLFKTIVFACAGFVGSQALAFSRRGEARVQELNWEARRRLLAPGVLMIDNYYKVTDYLLDYGARQTMDAMNPGKIDELLHSHDLAARERIAAELINAASEETTGNFQTEFRQAKRQNWLPNQRTANAANYVRNLLTVQRDGSRSVDRRTLRRLTESLQPAQS
jgi:hypothetical protein